MNYKNVYCSLCIRAERRKFIVFSSPFFVVQNYPILEAIVSKLVINYMVSRLYMEKRSRIFLTYKYKNTTDCRGNIQYF